MKYYKEFPTIAIPQSLQGKGWEDRSWHNDACPHSELAFVDGSGGGIVVWVERDESDKREFASAKKFLAEFQPNMEEWTENGREIIYEGDSELAMISSVTSYRLARFIKKVNDV